VEVHGSDNRSTVTNNQEKQQVNEKANQQTNAVRNVRTAPLPGMAASVPQAITTRVRVHKRRPAMTEPFPSLLMSAENERREALNREHNNRLAIAYMRLLVAIMKGVQR
jgi:hypothetical protein